MQLWVAIGCLFFASLAHGIFIISEDTVKANEDHRLGPPEKIEMKAREGILRKKKAAADRAKMNFFRQQQSLQRAEARKEAAARVAEKREAAREAKREKHRDAQARLNSYEYMTAEAEKRIFAERAKAGAVMEERKLELEKMEAEEKGKGAIEDKDVQNLFSVAEEARKAAQRETLNLQDDTLKTLEKHLGFSSLTALKKEVNDFRDLSGLSDDMHESMLAMEKTAVQFAKDADTLATQFVEDMRKTKGEKRLVHRVEALVRESMKLLHHHQKEDHKSREKIFEAFSGHGHSNVNSLLEALSPDPISKDFEPTMDYTKANGCNLIAQQLETLSPYYSRVEDTTKYLKTLAQVSNSALPNERTSGSKSQMLESQMFVHRLIDFGLLESTSVHNAVTKYFAKVAPVIEEKLGCTFSGGKRVGEESGPTPE